MHNLVSHFSQGENVAHPFIPAYSQRLHFVHPTFYEQESHSKTGLVQQVFYGVILKTNRPTSFMDKIKP